MEPSDRASSESRPRRETKTNHQGAPGRLRRPPRTHSGRRFGGGSLPCHAGSHGSCDYMAGCGWPSQLIGCRRRVPVSERRRSHLGSGDGPVHSGSAAGNEGGYDTGGAEPSRRPLLPLRDGEWRASNPASGGFAPVIISTLLYADSLISLAACVGISRRCSNMAVMPLKPSPLQRIHYGLLVNTEAGGPLGAPCRRWPERGPGTPRSSWFSRVFLGITQTPAFIPRSIPRKLARLFPRLSPPPPLSSSPFESF